MGKKRKGGRGGVAGGMFEFLIRVSKTTVSPSRSLISQVNQCLRPYVSIYQPQCADKRSIHINVPMAALFVDNPANAA